jgi:hypothetical protein
MVSLRTRVIVDLLFWVLLAYFIISYGYQYLQNIIWPTKLRKLSPCYLKVQLPKSLDFDQAEIILFTGTEKPQIKYATSDEPVHFDIPNDECSANSTQISPGPNEIRIRTRDGKRYRYLNPGINTTWIFPEPVHHFSYYDRDFLASLRRD